MQPEGGAVYVNAYVRICAGGPGKPGSLPRWFRPIYHSKDEQIEAHLFLSILAFHTVHLIRAKLGEKQIHKSWATLKVKLNEHMQVTTVLPQNKTHCILLKQDRDLKPFQRQIFQIMGLPLGRYTQRRKAKRPPKNEM